MRNVILFLYISFISQMSFSQSVNSAFYFSDSIVSNDSNEVRFTLESDGFFKNNEYFNDFVEGYSIPGVATRPTIEWQYGAKTLITAGVLFQKFAGDPSKPIFAPIFRLQQKLSPSIELSIGELGNMLANNLAEPFYSFDDYYYSPVNYGLRFNTHTKIYNSRLWLNWQQFIRKGDAFREYFSVGHTGAFTVYSTENISINIPLQFVFRHKGGQINQTDTSMQTLHNNAAGIEMIYHSNIYNRKAYIGLKYLNVLFIDMSPSKALEYDKGYALYPSLIAGLDNFNLYCEYWDAINFLPTSEYTLYSAQSLIDPLLFGDHRKMLNTKLDFVKNYSQDIRFIARIETFNDISTGSFDYTYGFHLVMNPSILLKKTTKR